jgi:YggT family protein
MLKDLILQILTLYKWALFLRIIIDYVRMFARNWRPNSFLIAIFEAIYAVTEPAMAYVRRFVPPLRLGGVAIDLSFIVLIIAVDLLRGIIRVAL